MPLPDVVKAVIYTRKSPDGTMTKKEIDRHMDEQIRVTEEDFRTHEDSPFKDVELDIVGRFKDGNTSGRKVAPVDRDGFWDMYQFLLDNEDVNTVLLKKHNRFARQPSDAFDPAHTLRNLLITPDTEKTGGSRYRDIKIYQRLGLIEPSVDVQVIKMTQPEDMYVGMKRALDAFMGHNDTANKSAEIRRVVNDKKENYKPSSGGDPRGIGSNRQVLGDDDSTYHLPSELDEFERSIKTLNKWATEDKSKTDIGREMKYDNPWHTVNTIVENKWKYFQAHHAASAMDAVDSPRIEMQFEIDEPEDEVLSSIPVPVDI